MLLAGNPEAHAVVRIVAVDANPKGSLESDGSRLVLTVLDRAAERPGWCH